MNANTEVLYWRTNKEWYIFNDKTDNYELSDIAPDRAIQSFEMYKKLNNYEEKRK